MGQVKKACAVFPENLKERDHLEKRTSSCKGNKQTGPEDAGRIREIQE